MARPTKLTPEAQERICTALKAGATLKHAAAFSGISYDTLNEWRKEFSEFSEAINYAQAACAMRCLAVIQKAIMEHDDWRAAAHLLERRFPHQYGRNVQEVEQSGPIKIILSRYQPKTVDAQREMAPPPALRQDEPDAADEPADTADWPGAYQDTSDAPEQQNDRTPPYTALQEQEERAASLEERIRQTRAEIARLEDVQRARQQRTPAPPSIYTQEERQSGPAYERRPDRRMPGMPSAGSVFSSRRGGGLL